MSLHAHCHRCTRPFDLPELHGADPRDADRCPRCRAHLGSAGLGHTTFRVERHLEALTRALRDLADHPGAFTIDTGSLRTQLLEAVDGLDAPPDLDRTTRRVSSART
jgi:hypothetical protein